MVSEKNLIGYQRVNNIIFMVYDEKVALRIRNVMAKQKGSDERKMFGGLSFFVNGKMCIGILKNDLVVRIDPKDSDKLLKMPHVRPMDFTGKPMKGFVYVAPKGYNTDKMLSFWIKNGIEFSKTLKKKS